jgi:colicin import membrane protein
MKEQITDRKQEPQGLLKNILGLPEQNQAIRADRAQVSAHGLVLSVERSLNTVFHLRDDPYAKRSLLLAFAAHLFLGVMLFISVQWSVNTPPVASQVELWATFPEIKTQTPAVKPIEPRSTPPGKPEPKQQAKVEAKPQPKTDIQKKPDISINDKKKPKEDKKPEPKAELKPEPKSNSKSTSKTESKPEPKPEPKPIKKTEVDKLAEFQKELERERALADLLKKDSQRILGDPAAKTKTDTAGKVFDPAYQARIQNKVKSNLNGTGCNVPGDPVAKFLIEQLPSGEILNLTKKQSSGFPRCDDEIERAISKSSPLPRPPEGMYQRQIDFTYRPNG